MHALYTVVINTAHQCANISKQHSDVLNIQNSTLCAIITHIAITSVLNVSVPFVKTT